ncbi:MAG: tetratricopeptide repeat protein [Phycisphaerae bacterium]|nr:tetratricopeptide repeat protein [Phycisphaerae bacterium]
MPKQPIKYNPAFLSADELVKSFVVRRADLDLIVRVIRENTGESNQHVLVVGPRGIGKTMLVLRVAEEVRRDADLRRRWYPLVFAEESYEVTTSGEFWLEAIFHLAQRTQEERWRLAYEELKAESDDARLRDRALAALMDFAGAVDKRVLLVVENLNMLLSDQMSDDEGWILRHTLQNEPRIMLLASATSRFNQIDSSDKSMFEQFKLHDLHPLNEEECRAVWISVTGGEMPDRRIRPLQILTGGSPRLLTIISSFAAQMSLTELMDDLTRLVDDNTEYFKSHLDNLATIERKVYLALAEHWDPATAREVAQATRLDVNAASSLLNRLVNRGAVDIAGGKARKKTYQVAERLYNIYYLMRRRGAPSKRVRAIINFMVGFYGPEELLTIAQHIAQEIPYLRPERRQDHYCMLEGILEKDPHARTSFLQSPPPGFFDEPDVPPGLRQWRERREAEEEPRPSPDARPGPKGELLRLMEQIDELSKDPATYEEAVRACRTAIDIAPNEAVLWARLGSLLHYRLERYEEAEKAYRKAVEVDPNRVQTWLDLGDLYQRLKRHGEAEQAYRKAIEIDANYVWAWSDLGELYRQLERYGEAEQACRKAIEIDANHVWAWSDLGDLYRRLERYGEAEQAYCRAAQIDVNHVRAWSGLGSLYEQLTRYGEAEQAFRKAIEIDPARVWTWSSLGNLYQQLERYEEAEQAHRKAIEIDANCVWAWSDLGNLYQRLGRYEEAEQAHRKAIEIDAGYVWAWSDLGNLYQQLERYEEAEQAYHRAIEIDANDMWAWSGLAAVCDRLGRHDEAEEAYRTMVQKRPEYAPAWLGAIRLLARTDQGFARAVDLARAALTQNSRRADVLNAIARAFLAAGPRSGLAQAEDWARKAVSIEPDNARLHYTLAMILSARGQASEALTAAAAYLQDGNVVAGGITDAVYLFAQLAAAGSAREALDVLTASPSAAVLEPLVVGLRLLLGQEVTAAAEVLEVGADVRKLIELCQKQVNAEPIDNQANATE